MGVMATTLASEADETGVFASKLPALDNMARYDKIKPASPAMVESMTGSSVMHKPTLQELVQIAKGDKS